MYNINDIQTVELLLEQNKIELEKEIKEANFIKIQNLIVYRSFLKDHLIELLKTKLNKAS